MATKTTTQFNAFKTQALAQEPLMCQASIADITILSEKKISFKGKEYFCSENAMNNLASIVGLPKTFANGIEGAFGKEARQRITQLQKAARILGGKNPIVTLVASKATRQIDTILSGCSILPYNSYFDVFERMMNGTKMEIADFGASPRGGLFISTVSKEHEFNVAGMKNETFHPGTTFTNDFRAGSVMDSYLLRLVCSNGMVGRGFGETFEYNPESMNEFFNKVSKLKGMGFIPGEFTEKVKIANAVRASYAEVKEAADMITSCSKLLKADVDRFVPFNDIRRKFNAKGCDTAQWNTQQEQNAITNVTVWDVVNGITDFASHDYGFGLSNDARLKLQIKAGSLLSSKKYDTQNLVHVSL
jgi:hypothetical protein